MATLLEYMNFSLKFDDACLGKLMDMSRISSAVMILREYSILRIDINQPVLLK